MGPWVSNETCDYILSALFEIAKLKQPSLASMASIVDEARTAYRRKSNKAANFGSKAHDWCEKFIKFGMKERPPEEPKEVANSVELFMRWFAKNEIEWLHSEVVVGSSEHIYGGKFDAVARVNGRVTLIDFKTSKSIYEVEYGTQLAGYQIAYEEMGMLPVIEDRMILWIPKSGNEFKDHIIKTPYEDCKNLFLSALRFYHALRKIEPLKEAA